MASDHIQKSCSVGFVLLTHTQPLQIERLTRRLLVMFPHARIVCHHDFSKTLLDERKFDGVTFVKPHLETHWGNITLSLAVLRGIRTLYESGAPPEWFYLISGADYPVASAAQMQDDLGSGDCDAYLDYRVIDWKSYQEVVPDGKHGFQSSEWIKTAFDRYIAYKIPYPSLRHPFTRHAAGYLKLRHPIITDRTSTFRKDFKCYGGEFWFTANARAAEVLLRAEYERRDLFEYLSCRFIPEECVFQTILANHGNLKINRDNKRYIKWREGHHPHPLTTLDLDYAAASGKHFARKFDLRIDSALLDYIDQRIAY